MFMWRQCMAEDSGRNFWNDGRNDWLCLYIGAFEFSEAIENKINQFQHKLARFKVSHPVQ